MRLCFIADARSITAQNYIGFFCQQGHEVHVLSTRQCAGSELPLATVYNWPWVRPIDCACPHPDPITPRRRIRRFPAAAAGVWDSVLQPARALLLGPFARAWVSRLQPDLLHALRIPIEGEVGSFCGFHPFVISVWGNDFTLHSANSRLHRALTHFTLHRADGLVADCHCDIQRARAMGLSAAVPTIVIPGGGGIRNSEPALPTCVHPVVKALLSDRSRPVILNPRGVRAYVRNDVFFEAAALVSEVRPDAMFAAVGMNDWAPAERWIRQLHLEERVVLTPSLRHDAMRALYDRSMIMVSPTAHDGTPNTLLEAFSAGCFPICGDLPSIREWITNGQNGLLVDAGNPEELASAVVRALEDDDLRHDAAVHNARLVSQRANYRVCMAEALAFYERLLS